MTRTVDLVIVGAHPPATAAAIEAASRGMRVLVVIRSRRAAGAGPLRRALRRACGDLHRLVTVLTGAEVVCVDGVRSVEAVVVRRVRTGRLIAVNASAIRSEWKDEPSETEECPVRSDGAEGECAQCALDGCTGALLSLIDD